MVNLSTPGSVSTVPSVDASPSLSPSFRGSARFSRATKLFRFDTSALEAEPPKPLKKHSEYRSRFISLFISLYFAYMIPKVYTQNYNFALLSSPLGNIAMREVKNLMDKAQEEVGVRISPAFSQLLINRAQLMEEMSSRHEQQYPASHLREQETLDDLPHDYYRPPVYPLKVIKRKLESKTTQEKFVDADPDKCYALVLPGGGTKGAFQAGALVGLAEQYSAQGKSLRWDVVAGVSVGSFFAYTSLGFHPGENNEMDWTRAMWHTWFKLKQEEFTTCPSPIISVDNLMRWGTDATLTFKGEAKMTHLCELYPLANTGKAFAQARNFTASGERTSVITATRLNGGSVTWQTSEWGGSNATQVDINIQRMLSSCSVPAAFPPQKVVMSDDSPATEWLVDGGVIKNANLKEAIEACSMRVGGDHSRIVVDVVHSGPETLGEFDAGTESVFGLMARGVMVAFENGNAPSALVEATRYAPEVQLRHAIFPSHEPPINLLEADYSREMLTWGREVGWQAGFYDESDIGKSVVHLTVDLTKKSDKEKKASYNI